MRITLERYGQITQIDGVPDEAFPQFMDAWYKQIKEANENRI